MTRTALLGGALCALAPGCAATMSPPSSGATLVQWVRLPAGSFEMGGGQWADVCPVHGVAIQSFELARTPVTNRQYRACVAAGACTPAHTADGACLYFDGAGWTTRRLPRAFLGDAQPVVCVDWTQAKAFCAWVGGRLPSEAEWEYAARSAGRDQEYPWGDEKPDCGRADMGGACGWRATWPVCSKPLGNTEQGLCDMVGNAWEWTEDLYHPTYEGAPGDGRPWCADADPAAARVTRGGSCYIDESVPRAADRNDVDPRRCYFNLSFRPARSARGNGHHRIGAIDERHRVPVEHSRSPLHETNGDDRSTADQ